jgi:hypothetical protein
MAAAEQPEPWRPRVGWVQIDKERYGVKSKIGHGSYASVAVPWHCNGRQYGDLQ